MSSTPGSAANQDIKFEVTLLNGQNFKLVAGLLRKVADLKRHLHVQENRTVTRLFFKDVELEDNLTLSDYHIKDGDELKEVASSTTPPTSEISISKTGTIRIECSTERPTIHSSFKATIELCDEFDAIEMPTQLKNLMNVTRNGQPVVGTYKMRMEARKEVGMKGTIEFQPDVNVATPITLNDLFEVDFDTRAVHTKKPLVGSNKFQYRVKPTPIMIRFKLDQQPNEFSALLQRNSKDFVRQLRRQIGASTDIEDGQIDEMKVGEKLILTNDEVYLLQSNDLITFSVRKVGSRSPASSAAPPSTTASSGVSTVPAKSLILTGRSRSAATRMLSQTSSDSSSAASDSNAMINAK